MKTGKMRKDTPLYVQSDLSLLLEVDHPLYPDARDTLAAFAELVKSPEHLHTYRMSSISIWNACSSGWSGDTILDALTRYSKFPLPEPVKNFVQDQSSRYGRLILERAPAAWGKGYTLLRALSSDLADEIFTNDQIRPFLHERYDDRSFLVSETLRGRLKVVLIRHGSPAIDQIGYTTGENLAVRLRDQTGAGNPFVLRDYQQDAVATFHAAGSLEGGSGVIVLPCGSGKTVIGMGVMEQVGTSTLILVTSTTAARQWKEELLDKTTLGPDQIGEYSGLVKQIRPVTIATYHIATHRKNGSFSHLRLFDERDWGLVIYDEVHVLPAPVFQLTSDIQARRRLGLTATLVREDGMEEEVFALIGPKKVDIPWKVLESQGWIATAACHEVRVPMEGAERRDYFAASNRKKARLAAENRKKEEMIETILEQHRGEKILIIGTYVSQLAAIAKHFRVPLITGSTAQKQRDVMFEAFRQGEIEILAVSKVANFAVDLPDATVAIQVSGSFGSRQEEAQRLGRLLRPKRNGAQAHFYTLVTEDTVEQEFALKRQLFLCEQGYDYSIEYAKQHENRR